MPFPIRQLQGWWRADQHLRQPEIRQSLQDIADDVVIKLAPLTTPRSRQYVILVGYSQSGKTRLVLNHPVLSTYARLTTLDLHNRLNARLACLRDDTSVDGPAYWERQFLTRWLRHKIERKLLALGVSIVSDSCNLERRNRVAQIRAAQAAGYRVTIINVFCDPVTHARLLVQADDQRAEAGQPRTWWRLNQRIQQPRLQMPDLTELDTIRHYLSGSRVDTLVLES